MESSDSQIPTTPNEDSSGPSAETAGIQIEKAPRIYKKKLAKLTGLIQIACGIVSITCGIAIFCVPKVWSVEDFIDRQDIGMRVFYVCFGLIYCVSGILGMATTGTENNCLIKGYRAIAIFSSLLAIGHSIVSIIIANTSINCSTGEGGVCDLNQTTSYRTFQNDDGDRLNDSRGSAFANNLSATSVANVEGPSTCDGQAYPIIPRTELDLIKQIGHGGYSEVYLAKWNNHDVAAKRLHEECRLEAEVLARLDHPNIVKLIGVVNEKFDFFLVLELCDGGSLRSYLNDHKHQTLGMRFYDWAKQAARPIKYLKEKEIVHKDIKSPNYLLTSVGALKLGDFGLAKNTDLTITATERASYPWMAPELMRESRLSPKYDVYAFGVVLSELWTRQMPFEDVVESVNLVWRICHNNERPQIPADCPKSVADLMRWCWETDWKMRPNMEHVLSQLASAEEEAIANLSK